MAEEYQSIIYYSKSRKSGRAEADFGGGITINNLLFQIMKLRVDIHTIVAGIKVLLAFFVVSCELEL